MGQSAVIDPITSIVGATGSGKTWVAMQLAADRGAEIVSCDSIQVYRGFEVGCAKPTASERRRMPHHLLDVVEWNEPFDAQRYSDLARAAIDDIRARGREPIVCGGTGLYLRALRYGLAPVPPQNPELRATLTAREAEEPGSLYRRLERVDPDSARIIEPNNVVHIMRALEIQQSTGEPASKVRARHGFEREEVPLEIVALRWTPEVLRARIEQRARDMVATGLVPEVRSLLDAGVDPDCRPMRSVGYRQACEVIRDQAPEAGLSDRIAKATWAYARRQRTWLRKERGVRWVDVTDERNAVEAVKAALG